MAVLTGPPAAGNDLDTMLGALERGRRYLAWKCGGLDAAGLRATLGPSTMTLGGLLKHLALVEEHTFAGKLFGRPMSEPFASVDFDQDPDWEWRTAADDSPEDLMALWTASVERARALVAEALADGGLDRLGVAAWPDGRRASLRRHLMDMIEEYARHVGHADLLRESVDGLVGEDPADA
ncbi:DinB family protein [Asanoa siamensis]|uniref:Mini-circle protein n=1 Tax=Asanoa siamensis TaxID=926357 RepID=A0ABQ4CV83_9ACTN|nr:DinB family protein [Asanoa siamensis]GIF74918.1 mini-circle protein [Asanoa siamensis]